MRTAFIKNYARFENLDNRDIPPEILAAQQRAKQSHINNNNQDNIPSQTSPPPLPPAPPLNDEDYIPSVNNNDVAPF